jgi:DNA polymerase II small subunit
VGSEQFLEEMFKRFTEWLREGGETQRDKDVVSRIKYLIIAGDIVDGVGIYPEQIDELLISDIFKQYAAAAKLLAEIPDHITIVIAPGNHDAVRPSEPQPAIGKDIAGALYELNSKMVGNPSLISLEGVHFLVYHGRSFDDLVGAVPGVSRQEPTQLMVKLLQKRHLAPIYGGKVSMSPEEQDTLVIEEVPDVFHCGHVHIYDCTKYREVWVVNSGTFQARTKYMQKLGVEPTPGHVSILNLQTHQLEERNFGWVA